MTEEEKQELENPDLKKIASIRFKKKYYEEIGKARKIKNFIKDTEFYDIIDEIVKSDNEFTLDVIKPQAYDFSDYFIDELIEIISSDKIPNDKKIIYDILYLKEFISHILMIDDENKDFLNRWMQDIVEEINNKNKGLS